MRAIIDYGLAYIAFIATVYLVVVVLRVRGVLCLVMLFSTFLFTYVSDVITLLHLH